VSGVEKVTEPADPPPPVRRVLDDWTSAIAISALYGLPRVTVHAVIESVTPELTVVVLRFKSEPDVPIEPSRQMVVPSALKTRNHEAVPAAVPVVLAGSVGLSTPPEAAGANGEPSVKVPSTVVAVPPVAGRVPL
jgi:hypothetical protein